MFFCASDLAASNEQESDLFKRSCSLTAQRCSTSNLLHPISTSILPPIYSRNNSSGFYLPLVFNEQRSFIWTKRERKKIFEGEQGEQKMMTKFSLDRYVERPNEEVDKKENGQHATLSSAILCYSSFADAFLVWTGFHYCALHSGVRNSVFSRLLHTRLSDSPSVGSQLAPYAPFQLCIFASSSDEFISQIVPFTDPTRSEIAKRRSAECSQGRCAKSLARASSPQWKR